MCIRTLGFESHLQWVNNIHILLNTMKNTTIIAFFALFAIALVLASGCLQKGPVCGNNICEQKEDAAACPADCKGTNFTKEEVSIGNRYFIFARNQADSPMPAII